MDLSFFIKSILLGAGLAVDAFSVSCANALREPKMRLARMSMIAGVYAVFQFVMPMTGWFCVRTLTERFISFQPFIPWIAFILLLWIGGKMLAEGIRGMNTPSGGDDSCPVSASDLSDSHLFDGSLSESVSGISRDELTGRLTNSKAAVSDAGGAVSKLTFFMLLIQGVATSIDALSVGFTIEGYSLGLALVSCLIIGAVTFAICMGGLEIGKKAGMRLTGKADILGGIILIAIGIINLIR